MASKRNIRKIVDAVVGPAVGAVVAVLLATPLDSGSTLVVMFMKALPALAVGVAAGVATTFAARLLTFLGRKVRPWFRTRKGKLKALESEIEELYRYNKDQLEASARARDLSIARYVNRCRELRDKLKKLGIPSPPTTDRPRWGKFLLHLYGCVGRGDVEQAKGMLGRLDADQKPGSNAKSDAKPANPAR